MQPFMRRGTLVAAFALLTLVVWTSHSFAFESLYGAPLPAWFKTYTPTHEVGIEQSTLTMRDGTELSVTYFKPVAKQAGEKFPVVLEMLPYRKDDYFYSRDYAIYRYLAERGIGGARIDIRGTGSSAGRLVDREYSDAELADLEEAIGKVAALAWCDGNIGMQGISWSAFNALMMAMRNPPALKAILVLHGSEDLYANDVHNIDGALHLDIFTQEMETANLMPRSPDYVIDADYFRDRFYTEPWLFAYLRHQRDGPFWRDGRSLYTAYDSVQVPVYTIGALLDGYRDYVINILDHVKSPVRAEIGPWNHAFPDTGAPGPNYDFKQAAVRWWKQWLAGEDTGITREPNFVTFVRDAIPAANDYEVTPGAFHAPGWPVPGQRPITLHPRSDGALEQADGAVSVLELSYQPAAGIDVGSWWGERSGDMREADRGALLFVSQTFDKPRILIGRAAARLKVSADAPQANWVVRLEDIHPDGSISLITGGIANGAQRLSRTEPSPIPLNEPFEMTIPMRFTTYTMEPGHRLQLVVSNSQFPMIWPTAHLMTTKLYLGSGASSVTLPFVASAGPAADYLLKLPPGDDPTPPDFSEISGALGPAPVPVVTREGSVVHAKQSEDETWRIGDLTYSDEETVDYSVDESDPAQAGFEGMGQASVKGGNVDILLSSHVLVSSDASAFHVEITRAIRSHGKLLRQMTWRESLPRDFQ